MEKLSEESHRRYNPLSAEWILCSPHRAKRPWLGQTEETTLKKLNSYDPKCYLCPRNNRIGGEINPNYSSTFLFKNDFPAVKEDQQKDTSFNQNLSIKDQLFQAKSVRGCCEVICFSPNHCESMAEMPPATVLHIIKAWISAYERLSKLDYVNHVQIFENKGAIMGCSNPHPHGQIWATEHVPEEPSKEIKSLKAYQQKNNSCLLCDYVKQELEEKVRVVLENDSFVCLVPFWALWPYETIVLPKNHLRKLTEFNEKEQIDLASIMGGIACKYDNVFESSFPYSMGIHQVASDELDTTDILNDFHFHIHFYPPLLRSASVKKFLVGFEMLGEAQRDITAEQSAERLRLCSDTHYSKK